ncbi:hypothetical protein M8C21_016892 [Ambrosia artemisiifolia]|uniref:Uncharacterized protein n=1 Tax=Ambrosia artemisiifolia TaxID=4212 RepID=A0AAD5CNA5_AMBAR|nr:hypothetical protein M8C21_016892 [Ambrosia artemisiifolia]
MGGWEKWLTNSGGVFPLLQELHIENCPNLVEVKLEVLPSLNVLNINTCDSGVLRRLVEVASAITKLEIREISGLNDVVWRGITVYLGAIEELSIFHCNEIRYLWESEAVASKVLVKLIKLKVGRCDNLVSLGEKEEGDNCRSNFLRYLKTLEVCDCSKMECCSCPDNIEMLRVASCTSLTSIFFPTGGQKLKSLEIIFCEKLLEKEWRRQKTNSNNTIIMPILEDAYISDWTVHKSIIELKYLVHLTSLTITWCESLESFSGNELPNLTLLTHLQIHNCSNLDASFCGNWPLNLRFSVVGKLKKSISEWGQQNFPTSLVKLWLYGDDGVSSSSQISHLLPSSLTSLGIRKLVAEVSCGAVLVKCNLERL